MTFGFVENVQHFKYVNYCKSQYKYRLFILRDSRVVIFSQDVDRASSKWFSETTAGLCLMFPRQECLPHP